MAKKLNYHESAFWQERYKQNVCEWFEWLVTPNQLSALFENHLPNPSTILQLGCGSSNFAEKLMTMNHQAVTCLDFSKEIIKNKQKNAKEGITYKVHDILQPLPFDEGAFDAIVQKNTLDCLFCFEDFPKRIFKVMKECYRVLKEGGVMISISHGKEKIRRFFYRTRFSPFNLKVIPVDDLKAGQPNVFMYILTKGEPLQRGQEPEQAQAMIKEQENEYESEPQEVQQQAQEENQIQPQQKEEEIVQEDEKGQAQVEEKEEQEQQNYEFDEDQT